MNNKTFYYARASSKEQDLDRQITTFKKFGATEHEFIFDKENEKNLKRSSYQALKTTMLRDGDTLVIESLDRLCYDICQLLNSIIEGIRKNRKSG